LDRKIEEFLSKGGNIENVPIQKRTIDVPKHLRDYVDTELDPVHRRSPDDFKLNDCIGSEVLDV
jgi:hypothetical protein